MQIRSVAPLPEAPPSHFSHPFPGNRRLVRHTKPPWARLLRMAIGHKEGQACRPNHQHTFRITNSSREPRCARTTHDNHIDPRRKSSRLISVVMKPPCHECTFPRRKQLAAAPLLRCYASSERQGLRRKKWIPETFRSSANRHFFDTDRHPPCPASTPADAP